VTDEQQAILVIGPDVGHRWELAWALHEAGITAEQAGTGEQALRRVVHGRLAGLVVDGITPADEVDQLVREVHPDPASGEVPFVLVTSGHTDSAAVVGRVQALLHERTGAP
jgi:DNA-binding NtrC family response regulator